MNKKTILILFLIVDALLVGFLLAVKSGLFSSLTPPPETQPPNPVSSTVFTPETTNSPDSDSPIQTEDPTVTSSPERTNSINTLPPRGENPLVAISTIDGHTEPIAFINAVRKAGFDYILLPFITTEEEAAQYLTAVDALIMVGGQDISPSYYGEKANPAAGLEISRARDISDVLFVQEALKIDLPLLGVCRGMQIMNVVRGGSLYQDIMLQVPSLYVQHIVPYTKGATTHSLTTVVGSRMRTLLGDSLTVNSWHHQAIKQVGTNVRITAYSPIDGIAEAIELTDCTFAIGVQFHPEEYEQTDDLPFLTIFSALRDAALKQRTGE